MFIWGFAKTDKVVVEVKGLVLNHTGLVYFSSLVKNIGSHPHFNLLESSRIKSSKKYYSNENEKTSCTSNSFKELLLKQWTQLKLCSVDLMLRIIVLNALILVCLSSVNRVYIQSGLIVLCCYAVSQSQSASSTTFTKH